MRYKNPDKPFERQHGPPERAIYICDNCRTHRLKWRHADWWCKQCGARTGSRLDQVLEYRLHRVWDRGESPLPLQTEVP